MNTLESLTKKRNGLLEQQAKFTAELNATNQAIEQKREEIVQAMLQDGPISDLEQSLLKLESRAKVLPLAIAQAGENAGALVQEIAAAELEQAKEKYAQLIDILQAQIPETFKAIVAFDDFIQRFETLRNQANAIQMLHSSDIRPVMNFGFPSSFQGEWEGFLLMLERNYPELYDQTGGRSIMVKLGMKRAPEPSLLEKMGLNVGRSNWKPSGKATIATGLEQSSPVIPTQY